MEDDRLGGIGGGGGKNKGKNVVKAEADARREQAKKTERGEPADKFPFPEDFGDSSIVEFNYVGTHKHLIEKIIAQSRDDCWAWALVRILQFFYNKDITVVAERMSFSINSLVKHVILGRKELERPGATRKLEKMSLAVSSLKKAIDYIRNTGIERDYGTAINKMKAEFIAKPDATPEEIGRLLRTYGLIGISVDIDAKLNALKNGIHIVHEPREGMGRHALIILGAGRTKDNRLFFIVQNTWGTDWGINGYGRIIIEKTCPIFYCISLLK